jgi:predicted permease
LRNLMTEDLGFDRTNLLLFSIDASRAGYKGQRLADFYLEMQRRIEAIPGVRSATMSRHFLVNDGQGGEGVVIEGYVPKPGESDADGSIDIYTHYVGSRFFETLGIPPLLGRTIQDGDTGAAPRVGVVNQAFAKRYFGASSPIGRHFRFGSADPLEIAIVGVVGDATYGDMRKDPPPTVYVPFDQHLNILAWQNVEVRTAGNPMSVVNAVRRTIQGLDRNVPMHDLMTETEQIDEATFQERLFARLSTFFALLALTLACVGLYGTLSYAVARRTNEIGIRMAIGAERSSIVRMVLGEALLLALIGIVIGIPTALAASRLISTMLYGLKPTDPFTLAAATLLMIGVAALAGHLPARRASRVDPIVALRYE